MTRAVSNAREGREKKKASFLTSVRKEAFY
jgi:hypothetical protein